MNEGRMGYSRETDCTEANNGAPIAKYELPNGRRLADVRVMASDSEGGEPVQTCFCQSQSLRLLPGVVRAAALAHCGSVL
jgi:hypothetical protein